MFSPHRFVVIFIIIIIFVCILHVKLCIAIFLVASPLGSESLCTICSLLINIKV